MGVRSRFLFLADASDTSVSGADASGATLSFSDGAYVDVYLNGVLLKAGTDYNTSTANTVAGLSALAANDEVTVIVYDVFTVGDMVSASDGGTFVGNVAMSGTLGVTGATTTAAITASGIIKTDATTDATSTTDGSLQTDGGLSVAKDAVIGDDLLMLSDSAAIKFGADSDVTVTHDPDDGLILKSAATADDNPFLLTLQTGETDLAADDVIGKIAFQAPDEGTGTDAILVSAAIQARAEGDHSSSSNATSLDFMTGASEAAVTRMTLTSAGNLGINTSSPDAKLDVEGTTDAELRITRTTASVSGASSDQGAVLNLFNDIEFENGYDGNATVGQILFTSDDGSTGRGIRSKIACSKLGYSHSETLDFYVSPNNTTTNQVSATSNSTSKHMSIFGEGSVKFPSLQNLELTALNKAPHIKTTDQLTQLADDAHITVSNASEPMQGLLIVTNYNLGHTGIFRHDYASSTTTLISGNSGGFANSDSDGYICVYTAVNSYDVYIKNRQGSARDIKALFLGTYQ